MPAALVTGANRGFGLALCSALVERGYDVVAACRQSSPGLEALPVRSVDGVDVATERGEEALAEALRGTALDVVVANAGIVRSMGLDDLDPAAITEQFEVN